MVRDKQSGKIFTTKENFNQKQNSSTQVYLYTNITVDTA